MMFDFGIFFIYNTFERKRTASDLLAVFILFIHIIDVCPVHIV